MKRRHRSGLLPEQSVYRDDGCVHHPACLTCPFPRCVHDDPAAFYAHLNGIAARVQEARVLRGGQTPILTIAAKMGVSRRTVQRDLASIRGGYGPGGAALLEERAMVTRPVKKRRVENAWSPRQRAKLREDIR